MGQPVQQITPPPANSPRSNAFQDLLGDALGKVSDAPETTPGQVSGLEEIPSKPVSVKPSNPPVQEQTDHLLGLLDQYSAQLGNPDMSLKQIAPALEEIITHAETLLEDARSDKNLDAGLKRIAAETAVTANREYLKFQRGDYTG